MVDQDPRLSVFEVGNNLDGLELHNQVRSCLSWIYANREFRQYRPPFPPGFDLINSVRPFIYRPSCVDVNEFYAEGDLLEDHESISIRNGFAEHPIGLFSGFRLNLTRYKGILFYFNEPYGLTACAVSEFWNEGIMPVYELDNHIKVITPIWPLFSSNN